MDYLKLIRAFWKAHDKETFSGNETLLYWRLVELFNEEGTGSAWPETMRFGDGILCRETGLSPNTLGKVRDVLVSRSLIAFQSTGKGSRNGGIYGLLNTYNSSKRSPATSSKIEEVVEEVTEVILGQPPQQPTQQPPQQPPQFLSNSHIYSSNQTTNPKPQTFFLNTPQEENGERADDELSGFSPADIEAFQQNLPAAGTPPTPSSGGPPPPKRIVRGREQPTMPRLNIPFEVWWDAYDLKTNQPACQISWAALTDEERQTALTHTGRYVMATPEKRYRKAPESYLSQKSFNDEIIERHESSQTQSNGRPRSAAAPGHQSPQQRSEFLGSVFAAIDSVAGSKRDG